MDLTWLDIILFSLTLLLSVCIGLYFANKNESMEDYTLGGRKQSLWPVSLSMMTSFVSGLTIVGSGSEIYENGIHFALSAIPMLLHLPISVYLLLPVFNKLDSISIYSYFEFRYSPLTKRLVSLSFVIQMLLYNAVVLYVPALMLQSVLGVSNAISIGLAGLSCLLYSTLGGIKAVIWTDFFQAGIMFLSLLVVCVGGTLNEGGLSRILQLSYDGGRLDIWNFFNLDLKTRFTLFNLCLGGTVINIFSNSANQIQVQRALSLPTLRQAQWSMVLSSILIAIISLISYYTGLMLYAAYKDCDPHASGQLERRDGLVVYYVATRLAHIDGLKGILMAGVIAASLSCLSSFQNSISTLIIEDIIKPALARPLSERAEMSLGKYLALLAGLSCIVMTFAVGKITGLLMVAYSVFGIFGAPVVTAYLMGMLTQYTNNIGILTGMTVSLCLGIIQQLYQIIDIPERQPDLPISTLGCNSSSTHYMKLVDRPSQTPPDSNLDSFLNAMISMSSFWSPFFSMMITIIVATVVSLCSGGLKQQVHPRYLADFRSGSERKYELSRKQTDKLTLA